MTIVEQLKLAGIDATQIAPKLYQGAAINPNLVERQLAELGFSTVVFCAEEHQPDYYGDRLRAVRVPLDDTGDVAKATGQFGRALDAARVIAPRPGRTLITCHMGINRSGLVSAMVLKLRGVPMTEAIEAVRKRHAYGRVALCNPVFVDLLRAWTA